MKKYLALYLLCLCACSKKGGSPAGSTSASIQITYPDGRNLSYDDYSVKGGTLGYTIDNTESSNAPVDWISDITGPGEPEFYIYHFSGYNNGGYRLLFATPPGDNFTNYTEDLSTFPAVSGMTANSFSLQLKDTFYTASYLQVTVSGPSTDQSPFNGSFSITFQVDSVTTGNTKIHYPTPGAMTIKGTFSNVGLIN